MLSAEHVESVESFLRDVWTSVLNCAEIAPSDSFIDLGGDSIAAVLCVNRIRAAYDVEVSVDTLLAHSLTLREMARHVVDQAGTVEARAAG